MNFIKYALTRQPIVFFLAVVGIVINLIYINHLEDILKDNNLLTALFGQAILVCFTIGMFWYVISLYFKNLEK